MLTTIITILCVLSAIFISIGMYMMCVSAKKADMDLSKMMSKMDNESKQ